MKKLKAISLVASTFLILASCQEEKQEQKDPGKDLGKLHINTQYPEPGEDLQISYTNEGKNIEGHYYYMVNGKNYPQDIDFKDSAKVWQATIKLPDSAQAIAFNFMADEDFDNNDKKGYVIPLYNKENKPLAGSHASIGMYYARLAPQFGTEIPADSSMALIAKDVEENKNIQKNWDQMYLQMLNDSNQEKAEAYAKKRLSSYQNKELNEEEYNTLISIHQVLKNGAQVDSISKTITQKFPKGAAAKRTFMMDVYQATSLKEKLGVLENYNQAINIDGNEKDFILKNIAQEYSQKGDWENFEKYTNQISNQTQKASSYNSIAWNMAEKGENLEVAKKISKKSLEAIKQEQESLESKPDYLSNNLYTKNLDRTYQMYADTYAYTSFKQGNTKEAVTYQAQAVGEGRNADMNERYIEYLASAEANEKIITEAEKYIANNYATGKVKDTYKKALLATNVQEAEANKKLSQLEAEADKLLREELKKEMITEEAFAFNLKNLDGKEVSLESLKGKTVILDFWATWCGPCKASFPGMQKAVAQYKDNNKVEFLFVNTMENGDEATRIKKAGDFITSKAYDFNVVMDMPVKEGSREYNTSSKYGISGIPTKIIIGPNGKIKFKKVGYSGNNDQMIKEIDMMIELINS